MDLPDHQKVEATTRNGHLSLTSTWMSLRFQILPELHLKKERGIRDLYEIRMDSRRIKDKATSSLFMNREDIDGRLISVNGTHRHRLFVHRHERPLEPPKRGTASRRTPRKIYGKRLGNDC